MQYSKAFGDFVGFNVRILGWAVTVIAWAAMLAGFSRSSSLLSQHSKAITYRCIVMLVLLSIMNIGCKNI